MRTQVPGVNLCPAEGTKQLRQLIAFVRFQLAGQKLAPLLIGGAASATSILLSTMLMPFSVPVVSFTSDYIVVHKKRDSSLSLKSIHIKNHYRIFSLD